MDAKIEQLRRFVAESDNIVFFGGAGVSTESGIPDFRSVDGLYHQKFKYPPETILSHHFYETHKAEFFDFYRQKMLAPDAQPNAAHRKLAELERAGKLKAVITQNIDGLHQKAGSREVLELHGSVLRNYCEKCGKFYGLETILHSEGVPRCSCGGTVKPDVVLYEESLDEDVMDRAARAFEGTHDFAAVRSVGTNVRSTVRTIYYCRVTRSGELLELKVCANGFLYNMVRAITGTVLYAAEGKLRPEDIPAILDSGNRTLAGPTAPPGGLYLTRVWYEDERLNGKMGV